MRNCGWARDAELRIDPNQILCESYAKKAGNQKFFQNDNPLELISGTEFYRRKTKLFDHVVGFAKFSEFLIVAEVSEGFGFGLGGWTFEEDADGFGGRVVSTGEAFPRFAGLVGREKFRDGTVPADSATRAARKSPLHTDNRVSELRS